MGPYAEVDYNLTLGPLQIRLQHIFHGQPHATMPERPKQRKAWCMGPYAGVDYTLPYVRSTANSNTCIMGIGNPMPESTLSPSQGFWIWPLAFLANKNFHWAKKDPGGLLIGRWIKTEFSFPNALL
jgi:hypothetical protein